MSAIVGTAIVGQAAVGSVGGVYLSATLADNWLNMLRGIAYTAPAGAYVELHTASPGPTGTSAPSAGSTSRVAATFSIAAGGQIAMSNAPQWTNGSATETVSYIAVWDAATGGNFLFSAALTTPAAWTPGDAFTLSSLTVALTPLAA